MVSRFPSIPSSNAIWIGDELYCRTPIALHIALCVLYKSGYEITDNRLESSFVRSGRTPEEMEQTGARIWHASLPRVAKCLSCNSHITSLGVAKHGNRCPVCAQVTHYHLVDGSEIRFRFANERYSLDAPHLRMKVKYWEGDEDGWLYLYPKTLGDGHYTTVKGSAGWEYLAAHEHAWEYVSRDGHVYLKLRYFKRGDGPIKSAITVDSSTGGYSNYSTVRLWQGREYSACPPLPARLPVLESFGLYEAWHWAPWAPSPGLHEKIVEAAGQPAYTDYYQQTPTPWNPGHFAIMRSYALHLTTLNISHWDAREPAFSSSGEEALVQVARFCSSRPSVRNGMYVPRGRLVPAKDSTVQQQRLAYRAWLRWSTFDDVDLDRLVRGYGNLSLTDGERVLVAGAPKTPDDEQWPLFTQLLDKLLG